jgi:hypothetical protein
MIIKLMNSDKPNKRYKILMDNGKTYDFGLKDAINGTYIDHFDKIKRDNYLKRHYALKKERPFIDNLIPSSSLFSYYILWGPYTNINKNIDYLNGLWKKKHNK